MTEMNTEVVERCKLNTPESWDGFLDDSLIQAFIEHEGQGSNSRSPHEREEVTIKSSCRSMDEHAIFGGPSPQQTLKKILFNRYIYNREWDIDMQENMERVVFVHEYGQNPKGGHIHTKTTSFVQFWFYYIYTLIKHSGLYGIPVPYGSQFGTPLYKTLRWNAYIIKDMRAQFPITKYHIKAKVTKRRKNGILLITWTYLP